MTDGFASTIKTNIDMINATLNAIKENTGLTLKLDNYFTGLRICPTGTYFNVELSERLYLSKEYVILQRFANKYKTIRLEPCGYKRLSIFPTIN